MFASRFRSIITIAFAMTFITQTLYANALPAPASEMKATDAAYAPPSDNMPEIMAEKTYHRFKVYLDGGVYSQSLTNNVNVTFNGGVTTFNYNTTASTNHGGLFGVGFGVTNYICDYCAATLAASVIGATSDTVSGVRHDPLFDTNSNYSFNAQSIAMFFEPHFTYTRYAWQPVLVVGIGFSRNDLTGYSDSSGTASQQFPDNAKIGFAYELGLGLQRRIYFNKQSHTTCDLGFAYRYLNFGSGELGFASAQTDTDNHLQIDSMSMNALLLSLSIGFGQ